MICLAIWQSGPNMCYKYDDGVTSYDSGYVYGGSYLGISEIGNSNFTNGVVRWQSNATDRSIFKWEGGMKPVMPLVSVVWST